MQGIDSYEQNIDRVTLEQFVADHQLLVKKVALHIKRRLPSHIELEDLLQAGFVGLLEARNNFQVNMGASFETFASIRIRGSIIDSLRKNSWGTRESIRNMRRINDAITKIEQRHHKQPSSEEIAAELGISMEEHEQMCQQINICNVVNIDVVDENNSQLANDMEDPSEIRQQEDFIEYIKSILVTLPEREQMVLSLYYIEEFTFKQIGEILDLTEARICQLHGQSIARLQAKVSKEMA